MMYLIAAMTKSGVIGRQNSLPWNIPDDLKHFKSATLDQTVIMGRKTFESIVRPLPRRYNIVLSSPDLVIPEEHGAVCQSVDQALDVAKACGRDIYIIGGAYTYAQFLPMVDKLIISHVKIDYPGDVYFPSVDWSLWNAVERVDYPDFELVTYSRKNNFLSKSGASS